MPTTITTSYPSGTTVVVTVTLTDEDGGALTPNEASWSLYQSGSIVNERESETIASLSSSMDVVLSGDDLTAGLTYFVIEGTYKSDAGSGLPFRDWARIQIVGVEGVDESTAQ